MISLFSIGGGGEHVAGELRRELLRCLNEPIDAGDALLHVGPAVISILARDPTAVCTLAYKQLYAFPFSQVPLCWRRAFEEACLWRVVESLENHDDFESHGDFEDSKADDREKQNHDWRAKVVRLCDSAIIFTGAPGRRDLIDAVLHAAELPENLPFGGGASSNGGLSNQEDQPPVKRRRRLEGCANQKNDSNQIPVSFAQCERNMPIRRPVIHQDHALARQESPSMTAFGKHMMSHGGPIVLTGVLKYWKALEAWQSPAYWLFKTHGGRRLVPVELGSSYTDDGWGQKIMTFRDYLQQYLLGSRPNVGNAVNGGEMQADNGNAKSVSGYLAQHDLLTQIPALRSDILVPDYCFLPTPHSMNKSRKAKTERSLTPNAPQLNENHTDDYADSDEDYEEPMEPMMNIWLGPGGTVSPAHTDPHENILCQVVGRKYIRLFPPEEGPRMYPMGFEDRSADASSVPDTERGTETGPTGAVNMQNTSRVDVGALVNWIEDQNGNKGNEEEVKGREQKNEEQRLQFPDHEKAKYYEGILEAGECLYIPRGWWHYIESLDGVSCSVSFWWD